MWHPKNFHLQSKQALNKASHQLPRPQPRTAHGRLLLLPAGTGNPRGGRTVQYSTTVHSTAPCRRRTVRDVLPRPVPSNDARHTYYAPPAGRCRSHWPHGSTAAARAAGSIDPRFPARPPSGPPFPCWYRIRLAPPLPPPALTDARRPRRCREKNAAAISARRRAALAQSPSRDPGFLGWAVQAPGIGSSRRARAWCHAIVQASCTLAPRSPPPSKPFCRIPRRAAPCDVHCTGREEQETNYSSAQNFRLVWPCLLGKSKKIRI